MIKMALLTVIRRHNICRATKEECATKLIYIFESFQSGYGLQIVDDMAAEYSTHEAERLSVRTELE